MTDDFSRCVAKLRAMRDAGTKLEAYADIREAFCGDCDFYEPGDELECSSFKLLKRLWERGDITVEAILNAAAE